MNDQAIILILANSVKTIYDDLTTFITESGGHRPIWKIKEIDTDTGKVKIVDKLVPLRRLYRTLEKVAGQEQLMSDLSGDIE